MDRVVKIPKDMRPLVKRAKKAGWQVTPTGSGHVRLVNPDDLKRSVVLPTSPGYKSRSVKNARADLRRAGLKI